MVLLTSAGANAVLLPESKRSPLAERSTQLYAIVDDVAELERICRQTPSLSMSACDTQWLSVIVARTPHAYITDGPLPTNVLRVRTSSP
jgi:hypothetical protein